jgi:hypothetical protein
MDEKDELLETFKAKNVGRGVWYLLHSQISFIIKNEDESDISNLMLTQTLHGFFMIYCENIYCSICSKHALEYISKNKIDNELKNPIKYFEWLHDFHTHANLNSGREFTKRSLEHVKMHYLTEPIFNDLTYDKIQIGVWHFIFMLTTKCKHKGYILALYTLVINTLSNIDEIKDVFIEYLSKYNFLDVFEDDVDDELSDLLFEYLYSVYKTINIKLNIKIYDLDLLKVVYYNLDSCDKDCHL